ncbi:OB-fold domain-containing protein [Novosphingobium sp.]|uniref:Zn-ribbon domain-containing OB-fold protein n=1 Tax=Novosphingobium sp. TaxID=1874826 RepID=UPI0025CC4C6C|nr:OB-fold domain-containing protein [Novosphingobium sp.]
MHAIAEGLFTNETPPRLIGGRDRASGRVVFPCPEGDRFDPVPLGRTGTLWSWTVQRYRPKSPPYAGPDAFRPWAVGYVELPGETIVEARVVNVDFAAIRIGMALELAPVALDPDAHDPVMIPAFQPIGVAA